MDEATRSNRPALLAEQTGAVSFPSEELILVDGSDHAVGFGSKARLHAGDGLLHRAFSVFLLDQQNRILLHRRSEEKPLWPGFWTNSCCSHPRRGENIEDAVHRRLREELGVRSASIQPMYSFEYHARFHSVGSEHELCHVYLARLGAAQEMQMHAAEIMDWGWYSVEEVDAWQLEAPDTLTPWFRMEWQALRKDYAAAMQAFMLSSYGPRSAA